MSNLCGVKAQGRDEPLHPAAAAAACPEIDSFPWEQCKGTLVSLKLNVLAYISWTPRFSTAPWCVSNLWNFGNERKGKTSDRVVIVYNTKPIKKFDIAKVCPEFFRWRFNKHGTPKWLINK